MDVFAAEMAEYAKVWTLPPRKQRGWVHEVEVPLREGEEIAYESGSEGTSGRVEFNIHSHQGPEVTYHAKGEDRSIAGTFKAPWKGMFYLMWEKPRRGAHSDANPGTPHGVGPPS